MLPPRVQVVLRGLALLMCVAVLFAVLLRNVLSDWLWPDSRSDDLSRRADVALQEGRLSSPDGSGARELYEAALAVRPDQVAARQGLARVGLAALARASREIADGREAQARQSLRLALELQVPRARIAPVQALLASNASTAAMVDRLLAEADLARASGRLDEGVAASLPLYQRVLALQPRNQRAVEGREDTVSELLQPAAGHLQRGDVAGLAALIHRAERFDAGHVALPELRAGLSRLLDVERRRMVRLLASGRTEAAARRCLDLRGTVGVGGMPAPCSDAVVVALLNDARRAADDFDVARGQHLVAFARALAPTHPRLAATERELVEARRGLAKLPQAPRQDGRMAARVAALLVEAKKAQARGDWLTPPGESAWDILRAARLLAPNDPVVRRALVAMEPAARQCHADALRDNALRTARTCLDVWRQVDPADPELPQARQRLAQRWIAVGDERLEAGEVAAAQRALEQARLLDAAAPGVQALAERVQRVQAAGP